MTKTIKQLKIELLSAAVMVIISAVTFTGFTYAWFVVNNSVKSTTSTISARTNGFVLQIADAKDGTVHGSGGTMTHTFSTGGILSPASSDDMVHWYVCRGWNEAGKVNSYSEPVWDTGDSAIPGQYTVGGKKYYAYIRSDYVVYTVNATGLANVYLEDGGVDDPAISIISNGGEAVSTFTDSLRVGITTQEYDPVNRVGVGEEELRLVYAVSSEDGKKGNDYSTIEGWTSIQIDGEGLKLDNVTYNYVYSGHYTDQRTSGAKNWAATKSGDDFAVPNNSEAIAENVGFDGTLIHIYIWLEGTDSDCVNAKAVEDDTNTYDVTVKFAGVAVGN